jgi:carotenoid cleavage dioxygenase-like enzyme
MCFTWLGLLTLHAFHLACCLVVSICCRFEGDGMVHATRIKDGVASFCNHFVDTHKLREEKRAGFPIYAKVRGGSL